MALVERLRAAPPRASPARLASPSGMAPRSTRVPRRPRRRRPLPGQTRGRDRSRRPPAQLLALPGSPSARSARHLRPRARREHPGMHPQALVSLLVPAPVRACALGQRNRHGSLRALRRCPSRRPSQGRPGSSCRVETELEICWAATYSGVARQLVARTQVSPSAGLRPGRSRRRSAPQLPAAAVSLVPVPPRPRAGACEGSIPPGDRPRARPAAGLQLAAPAWPATTGRASSGAVAPSASPSRPGSGRPHGAGRRPAHRRRPHDRRHPERRVALRARGGRGRSTPRLRPGSWTRTRQAA